MRTLPAAAALVAVVVAFFAALAFYPGVASAFNDRRPDEPSSFLKVTWGKGQGGAASSGTVDPASAPASESAGKRAEVRHAARVPLPLPRPELARPELARPELARASAVVPLPGNKPELAILAALRRSAASRTGLSIPEDLKLSVEAIPGGKRALFCLALNDYYEARGEPLASRLAVAKVVMNRVRDRRFPRDVCSVVKESRITADDTRACQFSWQCDRSGEIPAEEDAWRHSLLLAAAVLFGGDSIVDPTNGAMWYHSASVTPAWAAKWERVGVMGRHVFYRDPHLRKTPVKPGVQLASLPAPQSGHR